MSTDFTVTEEIAGVTVDVTSVPTGTLVAQSASSNPMDDPFTLNTTDYAVNKLISLVLTGESNCHVWSRTMLTALEGRNKCSLVDGTYPTPVSADLRFTSWRRCNSIIVTWLLNYVSPEISNSLSSSTTARDLWLDLKGRYAASDDTRVYELRQALGETRQGTMNVTEYYTKQKGFCYELTYYNTIPYCSCGARAQLQRYQQKEYTMAFLMGLNECYSTVRNQMLSIDPLLSAARALSMVLHFERQLMHKPHSFSSNDISAMAVTQSTPVDIGQGSSATPQGGKKPLSCNYCHKQGHNIDKCYKLHGYPPGQPRQQSRFGNKPRK
ncbi:uncharacterized protein LOC119987919 [Tripterygium wilfordii]|uniref:uncharacterized protein LOC119987919 n=1 Tax=Tripterygium wilfordii TaxID=458696 RepID=UPI0018F7EE62|nr:uncharacterized protein LOC119987919 [Tripterygium wilfordii]